MWSTADGETHLEELSKLAEKDPEFYKYLQENDRELLQFDANSAPFENSDNEMDMDEGNEHEPMEDARMPVLTKDLLKKWQKALLEVRPFTFIRTICY